MVLAARTAWRVSFPESCVSRTACCYHWAASDAPFVSWKGTGSSHMPKAKEFTVTIEDKPGALGNCLRALAERGVNILAFQSNVEEGESLARFVADDMAGAKAVLAGLHMIFEETD